MQIIAPYSSLTDCETLGVGAQDLYVLTGLPEILTNVRKPLKQAIHTIHQTKEILRGGSWT